MFSIRLAPRHGGGIVYRHSEFFPVKAHLLRLETQHPMGTFEMIVTPGDGQPRRACRGCGKAIADWRARCLTCSAVPSLPSMNSNPRRGLR